MLYSRSIVNVVICIHWYNLQLNILSQRVVYKFVDPRLVSQCRSGRAPLYCP